MIYLNKYNPSCWEETSQSSSLRYGRASIQQYSIVIERLVTIQVSNERDLITQSISPHKSWIFRIAEYVLRFVERDTDATLMVQVISKLQSGTVFTTPSTSLSGYQEYDSWNSKGRVLRLLSQTTVSSSSYSCDREE